MYMYNFFLIFKYSLSFKAKVCQNYVSGLVCIALSFMVISCLSFIHNITFHLVAKPTCCPSFPVSF